MKVVVSSIIIIGFITVAIFGFVGFMMSDVGFLDCVNSLTGSTCPLQNPIELALMHIQIYLNFSITVLTLQVLFIVLLFTGGMLLFRHEVKQVIFTQSFFFKRIFYKLIQNKQAIIRWFALLEKPDPLTVII